LKTNFEKHFLLTFLEFGQKTCCLARTQLENREFTHFIPVLEVLFPQFDEVAVNSTDFVTSWCSWSDRLTGVSL